MLEKTATTTKHLSSGDTHKYYMYCPCCGTEYAIDNRTKVIQERGYFIGIAWDKVRNSLNKNITLDKLADIFDTTEDTVKRSIIFLSANSLINKQELQIELPKEHNQYITEKIKELINGGTLSKKMRMSLG